MLPELLFSAGTSMQDISRDEFNLLNGVCEKEIVIRSSSPNSSSPSPSTLVIASSTQNPSSSNYVCSSTTNISSRNIISPNLDAVNIKLEDSDLYTSTSWHHPHRTEMGCSKLLLQNSDDPLISSGAANCDDGNELKSIVVAAAAAAAAARKNPNNQLQNEKISTKKSNMTGVQHHQHPQQQQQQQQQPRTRRKGAFKLRFHHQALPPEYLSHFEATQKQTSKPAGPILATATSAIVATTTATTTTTTTSNKNVQNNSKFSNLNGLKNVKDLSFKIESTPQGKCNLNSQENVRNWLQKISEMQEAAAAQEAKRLDQIHIDDVQVVKLDSIGQIAQPKPKLETLSLKTPKIINYSDLPYMGEMTLENSKPRRGRKPKKTDICHLIYKNYGTIFPGTPKDLMNNKDGKEIKAETKDLNQNNIIIEEPLNLCLRDQSESLTISSDEIDSETRSNVTTPLISDPATDALLAANLKMSLPNLHSDDKLIINDIPTPSTADSEKTTSAVWPNTFIHPMALYYQKMIDSGQSSPSPGIPNEAAIKKKTSPKLSPKIIPNIKKEKSEPDQCSTPSSIKSNSSIATGSSSQAPPQKRKRSAIFIPPMPTENATNPPTEVSICKFKFTGGAKPTLQEKKMLSVDSDGNYRYYSGTGDKASRGYEFFPRESLQQSGVIPGVNCSGAFLNALNESNEKISIDLPPPSDGLSNELLQIPETHSVLLHPSVNREHRKKKKSKRSTNREKLEQTFKDKGFLIQTQQLESAEGATYCKFRQLKKFTRYLFRSWKDYLPGDGSQAVAAVAAAVNSSSISNPHAAATINSIRNLIESNVNKSLITTSIENKE